MHTVTVTTKGGETHTLWYRDWSRAEGIVRATQPGDSDNNISVIDDNGQNLFIAHRQIASSVIQTPAMKL